MTPMELAVREMSRQMEIDPDVAQLKWLPGAVEAAILAYLQAVAKDEETVEAVARVMLENAEYGTEEIESIMAAPEPDSDRHYAFATARAALTSLASRVKV